MAFPIVDPYIINGEFANDPNGYGYAPLITASNYQGLADMLNLVRPEITITFEFIKRERLLECLDLAECEEPAPDGPSAAELSNALFQLESDYNTYLAVVEGDPVGGYLDTHVIPAFLNGGPTRTAIAALRTGQGSRAEELMGHLVRVTAQNCGDAIALGL